MQLNPGPSGSYHAELEEATGMDPATPSGNIAAGCYLLGKYMEDYGDPHKAAMAYNMGVSGARNAWEAGITSTEYSTAVVVPHASNLAAIMNAAEVWGCDWAEILDAQVWAAPGEKAVPMPTLYK